MNVEIDGKDFDLEDPGMKAEAIREWLKGKADGKAFGPSGPEEAKRGFADAARRPLPAVR